MRLGLVSLTTVALSLSLLGCDGDDASLLARSCRGESVPNCRAYEYAEISSATLGPPGLEIARFSANAHLEVRLQNCGERTPAPQQVLVRALARGSHPLVDGGDAPMIYNLVTLVDDGSGGDTTAKDGVLLLDIPNPFGPEVPPSTDLTLRFTPRAGDYCEGPTFEVPYRTGPRYEPGE